MKYPEDEDSSGLYEASGLKKIFEEVELFKKAERERRDNEFWDEINENKTELKKLNDEIDEFWLT